MRQYLVRVHCCGSRWLVYVPALQAWTLAYAKNAIKSLATQMISDEAQVQPPGYGLDLAEGRVLGNVDEFLAEHTSAHRWVEQVSHG